MSPVGANKPYRNACRATYLSRIIGVEIMAGRERKPALRIYFHYVPIAVISVLIVREILTPGDGQSVISLPVLLGCLATAAATKLLKSFLPAVVIGLVVGLSVRYFL
nr:AzlD domain-containing protein [Evansella caseinilytica]